MPQPGLLDLPRRAHPLHRLHRIAVVTLLGFASGLPLALTGQALQAWLSMEGLSLATIGFLSLVGLPYTFKFLWAPLLDRFDRLPLLGRRRGWLVLCQLLLAGTLLLLAATSPRIRSVRLRSAPCCWPSCRLPRTSSSTPTAPSCCRRPNGAWERRSTSWATGWR
jgi:PAT family beta-lactamase induction signal transducer AmpG